MAKGLLGLKLSHYIKWYAYLPPPSHPHLDPRPPSAKSREVAGLLIGGRGGDMSDFFFNLHF